MKLRDFDRVVSVQINDKLPSILMISSDGMAINCEYETVPLTKRNSGGVIGMNLNDDQKVVFASQVASLDRVLLITNDGLAKKFSLNEIPVGQRNRKGLKLTNKEQIFAVVSPIVTGELVIDDKKGIKAIDVNEIPLSTRTNPFKPLFKKEKLDIKEVGLYLN